MYKISKWTELPYCLGDKESTCNAGDTGDPNSIPGSGRFPEGGHGNPFQYTCLENPHGQRSLVGYSPQGHKEWASLAAQMVKRLPAVRKSRVRSLGWEDLLEKVTATHSSTLAWRIPRTEEPGRLQSMGSQSRTRLSDFTFTFFHFVWVLVDFIFQEIGLIHLSYQNYRNKVLHNIAYYPFHVHTTAEMTSFQLFIFMIYDLFFLSDLA